MGELMGRMRLAGERTLRHLSLPLAALSALKGA
jgi:hypothetical protein